MFWAGPPLIWDKNVAPRNCCGLFCRWKRCFFPLFRFFPPNCWLPFDCLFLFSRLHSLSMVHGVEKHISSGVPGIRVPTVCTKLGRGGFHSEADETCKRSTSPVTEKSQKKGYVKLYKHLHELHPWPMDDNKSWTPSTPTRMTTNNHDARDLHEWAQQRAVLVVFSCPWCWVMITLGSSPFHASVAPSAYHPWCAVSLWPLSSSLSASTCPSPSSSHSSVPDAPWPCTPTSTNVGLRGKINLRHSAKGSLDANGRPPSPSQVMSPNGHGPSNELVDSQGSPSPTFTPSIGTRDVGGHNARQSCSPKHAEKYADYRSPGKVCFLSVQSVHCFVAVPDRNGENLFWKKQTSISLVFGVQKTRYSAHNQFSCNHPSWEKWSLETRKTRGREASFQLHRFRALFWWKQRTNDHRGMLALEQKQETPKFHKKNYGRQQKGFFLKFHQQKSYWDGGIYEKFQSFLPSIRSQGRKLIEGPETLLWEFIRKITRIAKMK